ncbi:MAG: SDR family oxidoreductase, partial [Promethearchaeia archaeon]
MRPKKGATPQARANKEIATSPIFARLRAEMGEAFDAYFQRKVVALAGDINKDYMGLSEVDRARVCASVHLLIHCAANVDFNERLDGAIRTNCRGPLRMLKLAELCPRLLSYVHVSTAYVNCNQPSGSKVLEELPHLEADGELVMNEIGAMKVEDIGPR